MSDFDGWHIVSTTLYGDGDVYYEVVHYGDNPPKTIRRKMVEVKKGPNLLERLHEQLKGQDEQ